MPPSSTLDHSFLTHNWGWAILIVLFTLGVIFRFVVIPIQKKKRILQSIPYCPSLLLPKLPEKHNHIAMISSRKMVQMDYRVNLYNLTCSCPRFRQIRGHYPKNDIRRLCRHLRKELDATKMNLLFDDLTQGVISFRVRDLCYSREPLHNSEMIVGFHPRSAIVRVYTYRKAQNDDPLGPYSGPVDKFTYNHHQAIWVYGEPPPNNEEILTVIDRIMTTCKAQYAHLHQVSPTQNQMSPVVDLSETDESEAMLKLQQRRKTNTSQQTTTPLT